MGTGSGWFNRLRGWRGCGAVLAGIIVVACAWCWVVYDRVQDLEVHRGATRIAARNAAIALSAQLEGIVRNLDQTLKTARHEIQAHDLHQASQVMDFLPLTEEVGAQMNIFDRHGTVIVSTTPNPLPGANIATRPWFLQLRDGRGDPFVVSETVTSRISGRQVIIVGRAWRDANGDFAGMVSISLDPRQLLRLLDRPDLGERPLFGLAGSDGVLRLGLTGETVLQNMDIRGSAMGATLLQNQEGVADSGLDFMDGTDRTVAYRWLKGYPLLVLVGVDTHEVLFHYYSETAVIFFLTILLSVFGAMLLVSRVRAHYDLSETRQALSLARAAMEQSEEVCGAFLASASQELQAPVETIIGYAALLLDEERAGLSARAALHLGDILAAAEHLGTVLQTLPGLTRCCGHPAKPGLQEETGSIWLGHVVDDCVALMLPAWRDKGIALVREDASGLGPESDRAAGNPAGIRQALLAMVSEAIRATPQGGRIAVGVAAMGGDALAVTVTDGHPGEQERSEARNSLLLARALVERQGGVLCQTRDAGGGVRTELRVPRWNARPPERLGCDSGLPSPPLGE